MTSLGGRFPREEARDVEKTRFISTISLPGLFVGTAAVTLLHDVNAYCEINVVCGQVGHAGKWATSKTHQKIRKFTP